MGGTALPEGGGKRHRQSLDATINVVPAIDLLSCCISFLLFTAVWTQNREAAGTADGGHPLGGAAGGEGADRDPHHR